MASTLKIGQKIEGFQVQEYCKIYGLYNAESYIVTDKKGRTAIMKMKGGYFLITAEYISVFRKM